MRVCLLLAAIGCVNAAFVHVSTVNTAGYTERLDNNENMITASRDMLFAMSDTVLEVVDALLPTVPGPSIISTYADEHIQAVGFGAWFYTCVGTAGYQTYFIQPAMPLGSRKTHAVDGVPAKCNTVCPIIFGGGDVVLGGEKLVMMDQSAAGAPTYKNEGALPPGMEAVLIEQAPRTTGRLYVITKDAAGAGLLIAVNRVTLAVEDIVTGFVNPTSLEVVWGTSSSVHLWVGDASGFKIYTPTANGAPTFVAAVPTSGPVIGSKIHDGFWETNRIHLLAAIQGVGAFLYDVTNPTAPVHIDTYYGASVTDVGRTAQMDSTYRGGGDMYIAVAEAGNVKILKRVLCGNTVELLAPGGATGVPGVPVVGSSLALTHLTLDHLPAYTVGTTAYNPRVAVGESLKLSCCSGSCDFIVLLFRCTLCPQETNDFKTQLGLHGFTSGPCAPTFSVGNTGSHLMSAHYGTVTTDVVLEAKWNPTDYVVVIEAPAPIAQPWCVPPPFVGPSPPCTCPVVL